MSNLIYICNTCGRKHYTNEEPVKCDCGMDDFGIHDEQGFELFNDGREVY